MGDPSLISVISGRVGTASDGVLRIRCCVWLRPEDWVLRLVAS